MKGLTVLLGVLASVMLVIYSAGDPASTQYLNQTMYNGQSVFVEDINMATVDGTEMNVAHQGFSNMDKFEISDIIEFETDEVVIVAGNETNQTSVHRYVILSHEIGGVFGKASPVLTPTEEEEIAPTSNETVFGQNITYVGVFKGTDGVTKYLYDVDGTTVVVAPDTYAFVQTDLEGNGVVLRQEANGNVSVGNTTEPFNITTEQFGKLLAVIAVAMIVGYTVIWNKEKIYGRLE